MLSHPDRRLRGHREAWRRRDGRGVSRSDTKLDRDVALKILPDAFAADPDRLTRFEREAKSLASLNHPHIAQIHGFEEAKGRARW